MNWASTRAFLENPTLSLTLPAAQRRFGADEVTCAGVLGALVDAGVLTEREGRHRPSSATTFKASCPCSRTQSAADDNTEAAGTDASSRDQRMSPVS